MNKLIIELDKLYFNEYLSDRWTNESLEEKFGKEYKKFEYAYCGDEHYILKKKGYEETVLVKAKDSTEALNKILNMIRG